MKLSIVAQIMALLFAGVAVLWGLFAIYGIAFPELSGEWAVMAVIAVYVINIPAALIGLLVGFTVRRGSAGLRRACVIVSLVALFLPFLVSVLSSGHVFRH